MPTGSLFLVFAQHPIKLLAFFSLAMAFASCWIRKTAWVWGSFLAISLICALESTTISPIGLLPIGFLALLILGLQFPLEGLSRFLLVATAFLISSGFFFHLFPGFINWKLFSSVTLSPESTPYNLWLNYDKPFAGFFILFLLLPTLSSCLEWRACLRSSLPFILGSILLLLWIGMGSHLIAFDPKLPAYSLFWIFINLFFAVIPEESLFRGLLQKELFRWLGGGLKAHIGCVLISSIMFTLFHLIWVANLPFLALVFTAGIAYGAIYQYTQKIESAILCHFAVNSAHFFLFTYPALST